MANQESAQNETRVSLYSYFIAFLCLFSYGVSMICRNVWNSAIAVPGVLEKLGMTTVQAGGLATAFYVGYVASNFFSGAIVDKFGPKVSLTFASVATGIFTFVIPFTESYAIIFGLRVLAGVASGPLFSACTKMNYGWFDDKRRATAMGLIMSGGSLGTSVAGFVFTPLIQNKGWTYGFYYAGVVALVIGVLFFVFAKERGLAVATAKVAVSAEEKKGNTQKAVSIFLKRDFVINSVLGLLLLGAGQGLTTWLIAFFVNVHKLTAIEAGAVFAISRLLPLFTGAVAGIVMDKMKSRKWVAFTGALVCAGTLMLYSLSSSAVYLTLVACAFQFFSSFVGNGNNTMAAERAKSPQAGIIMGWFNAICQLGSVIYPLAAGFIIQLTGNYYIVITSFAVTYLVVALGMAMVKDTYVRA